MEEVVNYFYPETLKLTSEQRAFSIISYFSGRTDHYGNEKLADKLYLLAYSKKSEIKAKTKIFKHLHNQILVDENRDKYSIKGSDGGVKVMDFHLMEYFGHFIKMK